MPGVGPPPKEPGRRAGHHKEVTPMRVIHAEPIPQPELPSFSIEQDGSLVEYAWPAITREWWEMWGQSPLSAEFTDTDWSELLVAARLHARFWDGDLKVAPELRLRTALYGATPADRARLRISLVHADQAEAETPVVVPARTRRGPLTA